MSPRTGRPKSDHPRVNVIPVRLADDERDMIREAAKAAGVPVGEYIRTKALTAAKRATPRR